MASTVTVMGAGIFGLSCAWECLKRGARVRVIEAARAMGASRMRIVRAVVLPEALGPLILGFTFVIISLVDMSAMAGIIGGGGVGNFAIVEGYNRFRPEVTWLAVIVVIVFVQALQLIGNGIARKVMRR